MTKSWTTFGVALFAVVCISALAGIFGFGFSSMFSMSQQMDFDNLSRKISTMQSTLERVERRQVGKKPALGIPISKGDSGP